VEDFAGGVRDDGAGAEDGGGTVVMEIVVVPGGDDAATASKWTLPFPWLLRNTARMLIYAINADVLPPGHGRAVGVDVVGFLPGGSDVLLAVLAPG